MPFLTYDPFPQCLQQSPLTPLLLARVTSEEVGAIYQTLSVSTAFWLGITGDPRSSMGKTICLLAGASVLGLATRQSLPSWNTTDAGFEELAATRNDSTLFVDELALASAERRDIANRARCLAFMIAGQHGRVRSAAYDQGRRAVWRTLLL